MKISLHKIFLGSVRRKVLLVITCVTTLPALLMFMYSHLSQRELLLGAHGQFMREQLELQALHVNEEVQKSLQQVKSYASNAEVRDWLNEWNAAADDLTTITNPPLFNVELSSMLDADYVIGFANAEQRLLWVSNEEFNPIENEILQVYDGLATDSVEQFYLSPTQNKDTKLPGVLCWIIPASMGGDNQRNASDEQVEDTNAGTIGWVLLMRRGEAFYESATRGRFSDLGIMNTADKLLASQFGYESKALREVVLHHPILVGTAVSGWAMAYPDQIEGMDSKQFFIHSKITALNPGKRALETPEWYLVALADTDQVESALSLAFWTSVNIGIILLCLALAAGTLLSRRIVEPLRLLREDVREIAGGNLNAEVTIKTQDELQELARDVNAMAGRLRESYQDLERSVEEAESRAAQLAAINQITGAMTAALTLSETAESLGKYLEKLAPIQYASIALPQPDIDDFDMWVIHSTADSDDVFKTSEIRLAFERERTTIVNSERLSERTGGTLLRGVVLPLSANQELIGTLNLASDTPEALNSEQLGNLTFLAEALAAAIQHHRLYEQVSEFAAALEEKVKERTEELQAAQVKLLQTEKFAATGRLAANLAHEINNPLGIIKNHLFLLDSQLDRLAMNLTFSLQNEQPIDETKILESKKTTTVCREEIERIARLTRGLLNFYRTPSGTSMEIDLPLVLDDILLLVSKEFERKNISIKVIKRSKIPRTFLSPDLVRQVFMNLLRNAEDAIEKDGKVSVIFDTDNYPPSPNAENPMVKKSIVITIKDSGKGIAPEHLDKIFDPFFTTKMEGKGTGLGLSVTLGIVERLQGAITVESKPEEYTAFTLRLPVQQGKAKKINAEDGNGATNADRDMDQSVVSTTHHK